MSASEVRILCFMRFPMSLNFFNRSPLEELNAETNGRVQLISIADAQAKKLEGCSVVSLPGASFVSFASAASRQPTRQKTLKRNVEERPI
jgi:hypothetical protein